MGVIMKRLMSEDELNITLKEVVDEINNGKKRGDKGYIEHNKAMSKVESLMSLNDRFGWCEKIAHHYISGNYKTTMTIETYVLNKKQAITVAASLNDKVLLWVMDIFEDMAIELKTANDHKLEYNHFRRSSCNGHHDLYDALASNTDGERVRRKQVSISHKIRQQVGLNRELDWNEASNVQLAERDKLLQYYTVLIEKGFATNFQKFLKDF